MTKHELNKKIAEQTGISATKVNEVIAAFAETVIAECRDNKGSIVMMGFGTFKHKANAAREGVNHLTGGEFSTPANVTIAFSASSTVKKTV